MSSGASIGRLCCIALTGCAGCLVAFVATVIFAPPLLCLLDIFRQGPRDEPPFQWMRPIFWLMPVCALLGGCAGMFLAWWKLRAGRLPVERPS